MAVIKFIRPTSGTWFWDTFDEFFTANRNRRLVITLGQPPDWMVSRAAVGGAYLSGKANMLPDDMTSYLEAVTALVERARDTHGRTGLLWQIWNEFDQEQYYGDDLALLGAHTRQVSQLIRSIDPTATILAPAIAGGYYWYYLRDYLLSGDGLGGSVAKWIDGVCVHFYVMDNYYLDHPIECINNFRRTQDAMTVAGVDLPIWITESGCKDAQPNIGKMLQQRMMTFAALGAKCFLGYTYTAPYFAMGAYEAEWNAAASLLRDGAVITSCIPSAGRLEITIDGVTHVF